MCPVKWQQHYDLMNNSILVCTRDLLLVIENITSNVDLDEKLSSKGMAKGVDSK